MMTAAGVMTTTLQPLGEGMRTRFGTRGGGRDAGSVRRAPSRGARCAAAGGSTGGGGGIDTNETSAANRTSVAAQVVGAVLKFPPLWEAASKGAKNKMVNRAGELGLHWDAEVEALRRARVGRRELEIFVV